MCAVHTGDGLAAQAADVGGRVVAEGGQNDRAEARQYQDFAFPGRRLKAIGSY